MIDLNCSIPCIESLPINIVENIFRQFDRIIGYWHSCISSTIVKTKITTWFVLGGGCDVPKENLKCYVKKVICRDLLCVTENALPTIVCQTNVAEIVLYK